MIRALSSFGCAGKNVKSGEPTEKKIGGHVPNWTKNSTLPCTMSRMQMEATGKHQCTMVWFVMGLKRSYDKTAAIGNGNSAPCFPGHPPRPSFGMSIRNILLMFVNSQLCKKCSTPKKKKKHSIAAYFCSTSWFASNAILHKPLQPFDHLQLLNEFSSFFFFIVHLLPKN